MGGSNWGDGPTSPRAKSTGSLGNGGGADACLTIQEDVRLQSPKPEVLAVLKSGDILNLRTKDGKAPIEAVTLSGTTAGSVVPSSIEMLLKCMSQGHAYIATVQSIKGGFCIVQITHGHS